METVQFVVPTYWEMFNAWSQLDLRLIVVLVVFFLLGFFIRRLMNRRLLSEMRDDLDDLKTRLMGAENLLSQTPIPMSHAFEIAAGDLDSQKEGFPDRTVDLDSDTTDAPEDEFVKKNAEPMDSTLLNQIRRKHMVRLTKIVGEENGPTGEAPVLGFEENPPIVGESYRLLKQDGSILYIPPVTQVTSEYILTEHSVYKIELLESHEMEAIQE